MKKRKRVSEKRVSGVGTTTVTGRSVATERVGGEVVAEGGDWPTDARSSGLTNGLSQWMEQLSIDLTDGRRRRRSTTGSESPRRREPLIEIEGVAERLGVTVRHVRRLVDEDRIPYLKWSRLLRFDPVEIDAWLDRARRGTRAS